jgi:hypothetical protein
MNDLAGMQTLTTGNSPQPAGRRKSGSGFHPGWYHPCDFNNVG